MQNAAPPELLQAWNFRQLIDEPGGEQEPTGAHDRPVGHLDLQTVTGTSRADCAIVEKPHAVAHCLPPPLGEQVEGRDALATQDVVGVGGHGVAGVAAVDHDDSAQGPRERHGCGQPGGTGPDHHHIAGQVASVPRVQR